MAYAQTPDVQKRLGRQFNNADEEALAGVLLGDVEILLNSRVNLAAGIEAGTFAQDDVVMIEARSVVRVLKNPEGFLQELDGNYSYMRSAAVASGELSITNDEWGILGTSSGGAFTIALYAQPLCERVEPDCWWPA